MRFEHRGLDPRAKLVFVAAVTVVTIAVPSIRSLAVLTGVVAGVLAVGRGYGFDDMVRSLAPFKVLVPIILVLNAFFYAGGGVLWSIDLGLFPLALTTGGLETSGVIAGRLVILAVVASWFATTTELEAFEVAMVKLGVPWSIAFMMSLTIRLVPEMRTRFRRIEEAQLARGLALDGGPFARARRRIPMLIPFLASIIRYGVELGDALTVRDFGRSRTRTATVSIAFATRDYVFTLFAIVLIAGFLLGFRP